MEKVPESQFVRLVMPEASRAEVEDATLRWFGFLGTVRRIAERLRCEGGDSRKSGGDGIVAG